MNPCNGYDLEILLYLDNRLKGQELQDFRAHLSACDTCAARLEDEQALSQLLRQSRPLYSAPAALRARVSAGVAQRVGQGRLSMPAVQVLGQPGRWLPGWKVLAFAAVATILGLVLIPETVRQVRAADYVETAVATHRSYVAGSLPAEIRTDSPEAVTAWFAGRVPFHFRLPSSESVPDDGKPVYRLTGARVVNHKGSLAALVTYDTPKNEKMSLLIASGNSAVVAGGDEIRFGSLTFHYHNDGTFKVITWSNHGLSYALVSTIAGSSRESCLVCHQSMADRDTFKSGQ